MPRVMYDSIRATGMPDDGDLYACYTDGLYSNEAAVRAAHPGKQVVRISAIGRADADVIDIEPSCVWPPEAAKPWLDAHPDASIYCGLANLARVVAALGSGYPIWTAHYTNKAHLCTQGICKDGSGRPYNLAGITPIGTQYGGDISTPGLHYDVSAIYDDSWFNDGHGARGDGTPINGADLGVGLHEEDDMANYLPVIIAGIDGAASAIAHGGEGFQKAYYAINLNDNTYWWVNPAALALYAGAQRLEDQGGDLVNGMTYIPPNLVKS